MGPTKKPRRGRWRASCPPRRRGSEARDRSGWLSESLGGTTPCQGRWVRTARFSAGRGREGLRQRSIHLLRTKLVETVALFLLLSGRPIQLHRKLCMFVMTDLVCVLWICTAKGQFTHARKQSSGSVVITRPSLQQRAYPKPRQTNKNSRETDAEDIRFGFKDVIFFFTFPPPFDDHFCNWCTQKIAILKWSTTKTERRLRT